MTLYPIPARVMFHDPSPYERQFTDSLYKNKDPLQLALSMEKLRDPNRTIDGLPLLIYVLWTGRANMVEIALSYGADPNIYFNCPEALTPAVDHDPRFPLRITPLMFCAYSRIDEELVEVLLRYGAKPDLVDNIVQNNVLHVIAQRQAWTKDVDKVVQCLLKHGANKYDKNALGQMPIDVLINENPDSPYFDSLSKLLRV